MRIQFSSIEQLPQKLPLWHVLLGDLGCPPAPRVAKALGLSERTVYRYNSTGNAPKTVVLAVFWLTRWGRSMIDAQAANDARMAVGYAESLRREVVRLRCENARLLGIGDFGSSNDPSFLSPASAPAVALGSTGLQAQAPSTDHSAGRGGADGVAATEGRLCAVVGDQPGSNPSPLKSASCQASEPLNANRPSTRTGASGAARRPQAPGSGRAPGLPGAGP